MNIQEFKKLARKYYHTSFEKYQYENDKAYSKIQHKRQDLQYYAENLSSAAKNLKNKKVPNTPWYIGLVTIGVSSGFIDISSFANPVLNLLVKIGVVFGISAVTYLVTSVFTNPKNIAKAYERTIDRYNKKSEKLLNQQREIMERYYDKEQVDFLIAEQKLEYFAVKKVWEELRQEFEGNSQEAEQTEEVKPVIKHEQEKEQERE